MGLRCRGSSTCQDLDIQSQETEKRRSTHPVEVEEIVGIMRRITTLILMTDRLDANYAACCGNVYEWPLHNA